MLKKCNKELEPLGFAWEKSPVGFYHFVKKQGNILQVILDAVHKSEGGRVTITVYIIIEDPFNDDPALKYKILLSGNLCKDKLTEGVGVEYTLWAKEEEAQALETLLKYGIPWLEENSDIQKLIKHIGSSRGRTRDLYLSLIYYHMGNKEMSYKYAQEWLKFCREPGRPPGGEPKRTYRQLASMGYHIEGYEAEKPYERKTKEITPTSDEMAVLVKSDAVKDPIKFLKDLGFSEPKEVLGPTEEECVIVCLCGQWSVVWGPPVLDLLVSSEKDPHRFMDISKKTNLLAFAFESTSGSSGFDWYVNGKRVRSFWKIEGEVYRNEGKPLFKDETEFINVEEEDGLDLIPLLERLTIPFNVLDECDWRTFRIHWK